MVAWGAIATGAKQLISSEPGQSFLSGLGGSIGSLLGRGKSNAAKAAAQQYQYNLALQQQAQEWNEYMYRNRYQMQVEDLEKAGINKLYGLGTAPSVTSGLNSVGMADYVGEQNNRVQQFINGLDLGTNLSAKRAQQKLVEQQTNTEKINGNLKIIEIEEKNVDIANKQLENKHITENRKAEIQERKTQAVKNIADAQKSIQEVQTQILQNKKTERIEKWHEQHPGWSSFTTGLGEASAAIMTGLAVGGGAVGTAKAIQQANTAKKVSKSRRR